MLVPLLVKNGFNSAFHVQVASWSPDSKWKSETNLATEVGLKRASLLRKWF
jgi:hypothetical protein